ncbi:MAG: hypothetical protein ACK5NF_02315 [Bacilli bacterium]
MKKLITSNHSLQDCMSISLDDCKEVYLVNSQIQMHNVDECIRYLHSTTHSNYERLTTVDAFYTDGTITYLIEFKNQEPKDINKNKLKQKYFASRAILAPCITENEIEYILVTKNVDNHINRKRKLERALTCLKYIDYNCKISVLTPLEFENKFA